MKKTLGILLILPSLLTAYLLLWPVKIDPQSWDAPINAGYKDAFAPNSKLENLDAIPLGKYHGPEDVVIKPSKDGVPYIYTSTQDGVILRIHPETKDVSVFATTGGRPLGMEMDKAGNLIVADAYKGLLSINTAGIVSVLTNSVKGSPITYADDLDIADDGTIYFTDASTKFGAQAAGSPMAASLLEILEHGKTGRLLAYDPVYKETRLISNRFSFANGVAMCPDQSCVLVIETGTYSVHKVGIRRNNYGHVRPLITNLPGFPDNINRGDNNTFWIGLVSQRSRLADNASNKPIMRKILMRLPNFLRPKAKTYGLVFQIDIDGNVLQTLQDPSGAYPLTTGAIEGPDGYLYITSLGATDLGRVKYTE